ncbi:MAG: hypothetical protein ACK56F_20140, partial [bacterium]
MGERWLQALQRAQAGACLEESARVVLRAAEAREVRVDQPQPRRVHAGAAREVLHEDAVGLGRHDHLAAVEVVVGKLHARAFGELAARQALLHSDQELLCILRGVDDAHRAEEPAAEALGVVHRDLVLAFERGNEDLAAGVAAADLLIVKERLVLVLAALGIASDEQHVGAVAR